MLRAVPIALDSPDDARLVGLAGSGDEQVAALVTSDVGFRREIPISEQRVQPCIDADGMSGTQEYVDELATEIRVTVQRAPRD